MSFSDYYENIVLDTLFETNGWIGLSTADPGDDAATLAEPSGNGYARVATTAADWNPASGGVKTNGAALTFPAATGAGWGEVTYVCRFDAATDGNLQASGLLTVPKTITAGQTPRFPAASLTLSMA